MAIIMRLDRVMADRKMPLGELADRVGIANVNLSKLKTGKVSAVRFSTLDAICDVLDCQPGDILEYQRQAVSADISTAPLDITPAPLDITPLS
ncbi:MAG: helix-turn-helix transcriptional regulator [Coriobacteriia bacterium]|nr:helix-turn-helix transcriptional regulator [Coriobacteriia bacterium]